MTKDEIFERIRSVLQENFDIDVARVVPEARLYEDLDIDSIDAVDLIVRLRPLTIRRMKPEDFKSVQTIQDVTNALHEMINGTNNS